MILEKSVRMPIQSGVLLLMDGSSLCPTSDPAGRHQQASSLLFDSVLCPSQLEGS